MEEAAAGYLHHFCNPNKVGKSFAHVQIACIRVKLGCG